MGGGGWLFFPLTLFLAVKFALCDGPENGLIRARNGGNSFILAFSDNKGLCVCVCVFVFHDWFHLFSWWLEERWERLCFLFWHHFRRNYLYTNIIDQKVWRHQTDAFGTLTIGGGGEGGTKHRVGCWCCFFKFEFQK